MREIQIRVLKGLSMLSTGWPEMFADAAHTLAIETLEHANRADHIDSDREFIKSIYFDLFLMKTLISNHSCGASDLVASETRTKRLHENGRLLCIRREHTESSSLLQQALSLRKTSPTIKYFGLIPENTKCRNYVYSVRNRLLFLFRS